MQTASVSASLRHGITTLTSGESLVGFPGINRAWPSAWRPSCSAHDARKAAAGQSAIKGEFLRPVSLTWAEYWVTITAVQTEVREEAKRKVIEFLEKKNLRITNQRRVIIDTVFDTEEHFTAEQLLEWAREKDRHISRATVYRTLPLLTESNLVHEMDFGKPYKLYDPNYSDHPNHNHLICEDCEKIVEFDSDQIESIENEIGHKLGFTVKSQKLQLSATCDQLKKSGACDNKVCN
jgi:Fur family ferric uptake transcriptional regulator